MNLRSARLFFAVFGVFLVAALLSIQAGARAMMKDVTISKDDQMATLDCDGGVTISGHDNKLTINGECTKVVISGNDNTVGLSRATELVISGDDNNVTVGIVEKIITSGDDNNISWKSGPKGNAPQISSKGNDNKIKHVTN